MGKATEKGRDINTTLSDLGIDKEIPPEDAARDAAETVTVEEVPDPGTDRFNNIDDGEDDGGDVDAGMSSDDEGEEGEFEGGETPPRIPRPVSTVEVRPAEQPSLPFEEYDAPTPALIPPPRPMRATKPQRAGVKGGLPKGLAEKAPGASKVKVFKREEGQRWFINDYTMSDLTTFPDFESFLKKYVMKDHGPGEYELVGVDPMNREAELGTVRLRGTPEKKESNAMAELMQGMMTRTNEQNERYLERMREAMRPAPQQNPLELLNGVMTLQEKISGKADAVTKAAAVESGGALSAAMQMMSSSSDKTTQIMMAMMQQQQAAADRQNQLMMTLLAKPKEEDPVMKMLLLKLMEDKETGSAPLPPPPPPANNLADLLAAMGTFMAAVNGGGGGGGDDDFKDFLKTMMLKQQSDGISPKEMIQLVLAKDEKPGTDDFRKSIDNMAAIMNVANNMNRQQEGGPAAGLFDALAALFSNRDFAGSIANTIRAKMDQSGAAQRTQIEAERQRLALQHRMTQRGVPQIQQPQQMQQQPMQQQPMQQQPLQQQPVQQQPRQVRQPQQPPPQQQPQQPFSPAGPPNAPMGLPPVLTTEEIQRAAERTVARTGKLPQLPADTHEHINGLATAEDEGQLVGRTIQLIIYFAEFEDWRPFSDQLLTHVRDGNKAGMIEYLTAFFEGLGAIQLIDATLAKRVLQAISDHFDVVQKEIMDMSLKADAEVTTDGLLSSPEGDEAA